MIRSRILGTIALLAVAAPLTFGTARATSIEFTGSTNTGLAASALFEVSGSDLVITLTNTSLNDVLVPTNVLTAVFYTDSSNQTLTPVGVALDTGSTVEFAPVGGSGPDVGGEWAYNTGLVGAPGGATSGVSSTGLGLFGPGDVFPPGTNLQGPASPDGIQYGIASAGDNPATGNTPVTGTNALIKNSVVITLSGLAAGFDPSKSISNVWFLYGTALTDPHFPGCSTQDCTPTHIPEPGSLALLGIGLIVLGMLGLRRSRSTASAEDGHGR